LFAARIGIAFARLQGALVRTHWPGLRILLRVQVAKLGARKFRRLTIALDERALNCRVV